METTEKVNDCEHRRSLSLALLFLDEYHPVNADSLSLINGLRDQVRHHPERQDVMNLATAVEGADFALRRGVVKRLPGLARRIRNSAQAVK